MQSAPRSYLAAALPGLIAATYAWGLDAAVPLVASASAAVATDAAARALWGLEVDLEETALAGVVVALLVPRGTPVWIHVAGSVFAVSVAMQAFGSRSNRVFHPGLVGWLFVTMAWGAYAVAPASPGLDPLLNPGATRMVEISPGAWFLGGLLVLPSLTREVEPWGGAGFLVAAPVAGLLFGETGFFLSGAYLFLGFFVATDPYTSPQSSRGKAFFGAGCGALGALYASYGGYLEGFVLAVVLMNAVVPWLDRFFVEGGTTAAES